MLSSKAAGSTATEAYPLGTSQGDVRPRTPLAAFLNSLLGTETGEEGSQLQRQAHVTADAEAAGHGDHGAADLAIQYTQAIFARHRQRDIRIRVIPFGHLASPVPNLKLVLSAISPVQIELVDDIQAFGRFRVQLAGERGKEGSYRFGL